MATVFDQRFAGLDITQAQFRTLLAIWELGGQAGVSPSVLAESLLLERATVTVLTTRLVERGLIERVPGNNRRTLRLVLTPAGAQQLHKVVPQANALAGETLAGVERQDMARLEELLAGIEAQVRALGAAAAQSNK